MVNINVKNCIEFSKNSRKHGIVENLKNYLSVGKYNINITQQIICNLVYIRFLRVLLHVGVLWSLNSILISNFIDLRFQEKCKNRPGNKNEKSRGWKAL